MLTSATRASERKRRPRPMSNLCCLLVDKKGIQEGRREQEKDGGKKNKSQGIGVQTQGDAGSHDASLVTALVCWKSQCYGCT